MEKIIAFFQSSNIDFSAYVKAVLILLVGSIALSLLAKFIFGKKSILGHSVSSAIAVLFIYAATVVVRCWGGLDSFTTPLPFVTISKDYLLLFSFSGAHYTTICSELLSLIILAFLVNTVEHWLSKGESFFLWIFFRILIVAVAYVLHLLVVGLFARLLPEGLVTYAPTVLLGILLLMLATGLLKILVGLVLSTVNPIIGGLYTFFFANMIGKRITTAVLTTALLVGLLFILNALGITAILLGVSALLLYIPLFLILLILWYLISCVI